MKCPICDQNENKWENVDEFRLKPKDSKGQPYGMAVCTDCGFISYPNKWQSEEEMKRHYRGESYRKPPTHFNLFAGERKNHFHATFLDELFEDWKKRGIESPKICEIGAAFGLTLQWIRQIFPKAILHGTELTKSYRRNAYHEFGITLTEDINENEKYDLIISYKVLEHQAEPDTYLEKYRKCLKPDGVMYLSVPTWFNAIYNFGTPGFDLEYYYNPNHINVWTREHLEHLIAKTGFEIVESDQVIYSSTYLLKQKERVTNGVSEELAFKIKITPDTVKAWMKKIKDAYIAHSESRFDEAVALWPAYPQAHISRAEMNRKNLVVNGRIEWESFREKYIYPALKACPNSAEVFIMATDFSMRARQWDEALKWAEKSLEMKPENPVSLNHLVSIFRERGLEATDGREKIECFVQAREVARHLRRVSSQFWKEATDQIYFFNSHIPFRAENQATSTPAHGAKSETPLAVEKALNTEATL